MLVQIKAVAAVVKKKLRNTYIFHCSTSVQQINPVLDQTHVPWFVFGFSQLPCYLCRLDVFDLLSTVQKLDANFCMSA